MIKPVIAPFGMIDQKEIVLITFQNNKGNLLQMTNYGGIVHSWYCWDYHKNNKDVLLGGSEFGDYVLRHPYFGAIVGRYANRIAHGKFLINGAEYQLSRNLPPHHLHGGVQGFDRKVWDVETVWVADHCQLILTSKSPHMEEGYPGNLDIKVIYTFTEENELMIECIATTDEDTHINLTNHCYFNLSGDQRHNVLDHQVKINAAYFTETGPGLIPTGRISPVEGTCLDFRHFHRISDLYPGDDPLLTAAKGFDHNFVLLPHDAITPVAEVVHEPSGRRLKVFTDQPAIQFYTGNWLGGHQRQNW